MSEQPTPAPWYVGTMNDALFIIDKPPRPAPVDHINPNVGKDTRVIAKLTDNDRRADADARLIAASPALFEYVQSSAQNGCATARALVALVSPKQTDGVKP